MFRGGGVLVFSPMTVVANRDIDTRSDIPILSACSLTLYPFDRPLLSCWALEVSLMGV